ncbi:MAG: FG-GAP-like repeat-containing protein [Blastocatellia bacterium]|nr:FG-GAP-like repeat-containing protein [Blastocatellia bacterium]
MKQTLAKRHFMWFWLAALVGGLVVLNGQPFTPPKVQAAIQEDSPSQQPAPEIFGCSGINFSQAAGSPVTVGDFPNAIDIADLNRDGQLDVVAVNPNSDNISIVLGNGGGGFTPAAGSPITVGNNPKDVVIADFNNNGLLDIAVVNTDSNNVTILLGNGSGGFGTAPGSPVPVAGTPQNVAQGDFDQDGVVDLVVGSFISTNNLTILLGNANGSFTQAAGSPFTAGSQVNDLAVADFNLDGRPDIAATNFSSKTLTVFLGNGTGGFSAAPGSPMTFATPPISVTTGDVDRDGVPDLVVGNSVVSSNGNISILLGTGNGGFTVTPGSPITVGQNPLDVGVFDFNADGLLDVTSLNSTNGNVTFLAGNGNGGFSQPSGSPLAIGNNPQDLAVADFNRDGKPDFVVAVAGLDQLNIQLNTCAAQCNANFGAASGSPITVGNTSQNVVSADFNRDGNPDMAVTNSNSNTVSILLGNGVGGFTAAASPTTGTFPLGIISGDWNKDGKPDLAISNNTAQSVTILLGNGNGGFAAAAGSPVTVGASPNQLATADFNLDGNPDFVVLNSGPDNATILLGNGSGGFSASAGSPVTLGSSPNDVVIGDFNRDGRPDFATSNFASDSVSILLGNGAGSFSAASGSPLTGFDGVNRLAVGDFNRDGRADLAVASNLATTLSILLGNGNGTFTQAAGSPVAIGSNFASLNTDDANRDGNLDLLLMLGNNTLDVLLGNGSGGFTQNVTTVAGSTNAKRAALADFDKDGKTDYALTIGDSSGRVIVLLNTCCPVITVNPSSIPNGTAGTTYSQTFTQSGGTGNGVFSVTGTLPAGLTMSSAGVLSGTPTDVGTFNFTVTGADGNGCPGSRAYSLTINCQTITLNQTSLTNGIIGQAYSQFVSQTGGIGGVGFSITAGALPPGITQNPATGQLSGTPTQTGSFSLTITATDSNGCTGSRAYTLLVCAVITVNPVTAPNGTVGVPYSQTFSQTGGTGTPSFGFTGSIPPGLSLSTSTGVFSGTPTQAGTFNFTIFVTVGQCLASQSYAVTINPGPTLQFSSSVYNIREGTATAAITVTRLNSAQGTVGVSFATSDGTATQGADYTAASGTLTLAAGELFKTFTITIATDANAEANETVNLTLSAPTGGATLGTPATAVLTIVDAAATAPVVTQFYPFASTSGKTITVSGSGFVAGNTQVFFGGSRLIAGTSVNVTSATTLTVVVPASSSGAGNINGFLTIRVNGVDTTTQGLPFSTNPGDPAATFPEFILWGDMTADGIFTTADVALARAFTLAQATLTSRQLLAADVVPANANGSRGSGSVSAADITFLRAVTFGQTTF